MRNRLVEGEDRHSISETVRPEKGIFSTDVIDVYAESRIVVCSAKENTIFQIESIDSATGTLCCNLGESGTALLSCWTNSLRSRRKRMDGLVASLLLDAHLRTDLNILPMRSTRNGLLYNVRIGGSDQRDVVGGLPQRIRLILREGTCSKFLLSCSSSKADGSYFRLATYNPDIIRGWL